jgi:hypothetical protein
VPAIEGRPVVALVMQTTQAGQRVRAYKYAQRRDVRDVERNVHFVEKTTVSK